MTAKQAIYASQNSLLGDHSKCEPPDPIPNSEVKPLCADDSVAVCHVKVGHRQAFNTKKARSISLSGLFLCLIISAHWILSFSVTTYGAIGKIVLHYFIREVNSHRYYRVKMAVWYIVGNYNVLGN